MIDTVWKNKEWLFSGVGVLFILWMLGALRYIYNLMRHGVSQPTRLFHKVRKLKFWRVSWDFTGYFLGMSSVNGNVHVSSFQVRGYNHSNHPITKVGGYVQSNITNIKIPILLESMSPEETNGIPPKCRFQVSAPFKDPTVLREGIAVEKFIREFGDFTFVFTYNKYVYCYRFKVSEVQSLINLFRAQSNPPSVPRVTKREK